MSWNVVDPADVSPAPWKNGGGTTRELLAWPASDGWRVRVSIADVERDGPFSSFPGVQRWFAVLEGAGVQLRIGSCEHALDADAPAFQFEGSDPVECRLIDGATRDFNLMVQGGGGFMQRVRGAMVRELRGGMWVGRYSPGRFEWRVLPDDERVELGAEWALWMEVR